MRLGKDLTDKPIITINDGRHVGKVKDIYLDHDLLRMAGIFLGKEGLLRRKEQLIERENVVVFGVDVILIKNVEVITDSKEIDTKNWVRLDDVQGRDIDTPGGTKLGRIGDVIFNTEGEITGFKLSKVLVDGPIAEAGAISRDVLIDNGNVDGVMTIDLNKAEEQGIKDRLEEEVSE